MRDNLHDPRQFAPATQRNRQPILEVLQQVLPPSGTVLEIASGTGEHAAFLAPRLQPRWWLPTDPNPLALESIAAWRQHTDCQTLLEPRQLDARETTWPVEVEPPSQFNEAPWTAIVCINMIHIAPWAACLGLLAGAERLLSPGGVLYLYGPYKEKGRHTAASNEAFDVTLRDRDSTWGVRDLEAVVEVAQQHGLTLQTVVEMPANNRSVVFRR